MPRDIVITAASQPRLDGLIAVAADIDPRLTTRTIAHGAIVQLVDPDGQPVLSISVNAANHVRVPHEAARLIPGAPDAPLWWIEAWAPQGERNGPGLRIARAYAETLNGHCHTPDAS
ncbi:MAG: hypothetical protein LBH76_08630 [Propionibacteriaceae bacterium]|jgi:hypothetical protein|nr:hypothetical protein [Propionibacteriaceae bacterium]